MLDSKKILHNPYVLSLISNYLPVKDKINFSSTTKLVNELSDEDFKEITINEFSSPLSDYSLMSSTSDDISSKYFGNFKETKDISPMETNWRNFYINGKKIKYLFSQISTNNDLFPGFNNDSIKLGDEMFKKLKEYFTLPNIRKTNKFVENDINTTHQTFLYDFLYDDQDLYNYYKKQNATQQNSALTCKSSQKAYSEVFKNLDYFYDSIDEQAEMFEEIRCYNYSFTESKLQKQSYEEIFEFFYSFNTNFYSFYQKFLFGDFTNYNPLIRLMMVIYITIIYFTLITFTIINDDQEQKEFLLLDNIIKRVSLFNYLI